MAHLVTAEGPTIKLGADGLTHAALGQPLISVSVTHNGNYFVGIAVVGSPA